MELKKISSRNKDGYIPISEIISGYAVWKNSKRKSNRVRKLLPNAVSQVPT